MSSRARPSARRGFTLVEILLAVSITAALLLATGAALKASTDSFTANQMSADTLQRARITMMRLSEQLRSGEDHLPVTAAKQLSFVGGAVVTDTGITFTDDNGQSILCTFDSAGKRLTISVNGATQRVLASHVSGFSVRMVPTRSATAIKTGGAYDELERVSVTLTIDPVVDGNPITSQPFTLSESITPRARLWN